MKDKLHKLKTNFIGKNIIHLETVDSTNEYLKRIGNWVEEGTIVISDEQTKGKGRWGRQWESQSKEGVWMSMIIRPNIEPIRAPFITLIAGASIVKSLNNLMIPGEIKWPNDIILNNKKIGGVLTELSADISKVNHVIVGIGINVKNKKFEGELEEKATSLFKEGYDLSREIIISEIICEFEKLYELYINEKTSEEIISICKEHSAVINKDIYVIKGDEKELFKCIDLNNEGNLIVKDNFGNLIEIMSGEVSIRGSKGYV